MTKAQAIAQLDRARLGLSHHAHSSAQALRPGTLAKQCIQSHPAWWIGGATVAGFLFIRSILPSSRKNERDKSAKNSTKNGLLALAGTTLFGLGQKAVLAHFTKQILPILEDLLKPRDRA